jgi:hypothetical protein
MPSATSAVSRRLLQPGVEAAATDQGVQNRRLAVRDGEHPVAVEFQDRIACHAAGGLPGAAEVRRDMQQN